MSFIKRAQDVAKGAAEQAQIAAGQAKVKAGEAAAVANQKAADPATQERLGKSAREAMGMARRGVSTVVERIDPATLAEVDHQGHGAPGDDQCLAAPKGLALPDRRDHDLGVDPARRELHRSGASTTTRRP